MYIGALWCVPVIDPCQAIQHSADHASPAAGVLACVSLALAWHYVFSWHDGAEPLTAAAVSLFGLSPDS